MLINRGGNKFIFMEEFDERESFGHISVLSKTRIGDWAEPLPVLEKPYHLSYPFVFKFSGKYYMVPESAAAGRIDLFEGVHFPLRWELHHTLMKNVFARDTTLIYYNETWWLFTALAQTREQGANVELFIFHSQDLFQGNWKSHPMNPVCSDIRCSRPAGRIFKSHGRLYRPSQDCSRGYGYGLDLNEIKVLTVSDYLEKRVHSVRPGWDPRVVGIHTLARSSHLTIVDALTRTPRFRILNFHAG